MPKFVIIYAPSILGLKPSGVEQLPKALEAAGLAQKLNAGYAGKVSPLQYNSKRDETTLLLNPVEIKVYSQQLAKTIISVLDKKQFPIVLGGDCSILIGNVLALRRMGRYGLFFIDGHADFYQPEASPTGEVADMELAIVSGRGPSILTNIDNLIPLVKDEDIVLFGYRDAEQSASYGSQDVKKTGMHVFDLAQVQTLGIITATLQAVGKLMKDDISGFWIHLDVDVLDDAIMPAVDYRLEGGLSFDDLSKLLKILFASGRVVGLDITIFNPKRDSDGSIAHRLVSSLVAGMQ